MYNMMNWSTNFSPIHNQRQLQQQQLQRQHQQYQQQQQQQQQQQLLQQQQQELQLQLQQQLLPLSLPQEHFFYHLPSQDDELSSTSINVNDVNASSSAGAFCPPSLNAMLVEDAKDIQISSGMIVKPGTVKCPICKFKTKDKLTFLNHMVKTKETGCSSKYTSLNYKIVFLQLECYRFCTDIENEQESPPPIKLKKKTKQTIPKRYTNPCKECKFVSDSVSENLKHMREHITNGYYCIKCYFATRHNHHIQHHWLSSHETMKPYHCSKCSYECVSKSMLRSHMKRHSKFYQFSCGTCSYQTRFYSSFKGHLRDLKHKQGIVRNPDGTVNPDFKVDVNGRKRGPRLKSQEEEEQEDEKAEDKNPSNSLSTVSLLQTPSLSHLIDGKPNSEVATNMNDEKRESTQICTTLQWQEYFNNSILKTGLYFRNLLDKLNALKCFEFFKTPISNPVKSSLEELICQQKQMIAIHQMNSTNYLNNFFINPNLLQMSQHNSTNFVTTLHNTSTVNAEKSANVENVYLSEIMPNLVTTSFNTSLKNYQSVNINDINTPSTSQEYKYTDEPLNLSSGSTSVKRPRKTVPKKCFYNINES